MSEIYGVHKFIIFCITKLPAATIVCSSRQDKVLQLFVAAGKTKWCDFYVYASKIICVQRIVPDAVWIKEEKPSIRQVFLKVGQVSRCGFFGKKL